MAGPSVNDAGLSTLEDTQVPHLPSDLSSLFPPTGENGQPPKLPTNPGSLLPSGSVGGTGTATGTSSPTGSGSGSGIMDVRSAAQIQADVAAQVDAEIKAATDPLNNQIGTLQSDESGALKAIGDMFSGLQPYVAGQADKLAGDYTSAEQTQQSIYSAANQRLAALQNERAQTAQAMAQQIGGPVAIDEFTDAVGPSAMEYANLGAGQELHTLGFAAADVGQARAFSQRVFPLVQTEQTAEAKQHFETQITEIRKQISQLQAQRTSSINKGVNDAMIQERQFALQKAQQSLDAVKAQHDWQATLRSLSNDDKRLKLAQQEFGQTKRVNTANIASQQAATRLANRQAALETRKMTDQEKQFAAQLGLSNKEYELRKQALERGKKGADQRVALARQQTAAQWLDAAVNPQPGKSVKTSQAVPVDRQTVFLGKAPNAYKDPNSPTGYSQLVTVYSQASTTPITDPNTVVDYLIAHNVTKAMAIRMVRARFQLGSDWVYSRGVPYVPPSPDGSGAATGSSPGRP